MGRFYYHLGLHYSQTTPTACRARSWFYYHLGLHYSQTLAEPYTESVRFYYHLGLHYSQTRTIARASRLSFTTTWDYTTLKPQITFFVWVHSRVCRHYKTVVVPKWQGYAQKITQRSLSIIVTHSSFRAASLWKGSISRRSSFSYNALR